MSSTNNKLKCCIGDIFSFKSTRRFKSVHLGGVKKKQLKSEQMRMFRQTRDQVEDVPCKSLLSSQQPISNRSKRELGGGKGGGGGGKYHATAFLTKRHCRSMTYQQHIGWKSSKGSVILNYTEATFLRYQERMTFHLFCLSPT